MGAILSVGIIEGIEAAAGIIGGSIEVASETAIIEGASEAASEQAISDALAGGATEEEAELAGKTASELAAEAKGATEIAGLEEKEIENLITKIKPLSPQIAEDIGQFNTTLNELINGGEISEEVAYEVTEIADVTPEEIKATGLTPSEFEAFEIETTEEFEGLSEEAKTRFQKLKELGRKILNKLKQAFLACKKSIVKAAQCIVGLTEVIDFLYNKFYNEKANNPHVIPTFNSFDPYEVGKKVGRLTAQGIGLYYDELVRDPNLSKNETKIDKLILGAFKNTDNNTLSRTLYRVIRSSKFIKGPEVQRKFDQIFKIYNGKLKKFPYRDPKTGFITYQDEVGKTISYKDNKNPKSTTTFYGTWCGPLSYNEYIPLWGEKLPNEKYRPAGSGLLDTFCFAHDCDYSFKSTADIGRGGWFNQIGDFILISRILHNINSMTYKEKSMATMTVAWFSTLGTILNTYLHPLIVSFKVRDPTREFKEDEKDDLYSILFPKKKKSFKDGQIVLQGAKEKEDPQERVLFYKGLRDQIFESQVDFISKNGGPKQDNQYSSLLKQFDEIIVFA